MPYALGIRDNKILTVNSGVLSCLSTESLGLGTRIRYRLSLKRTGMATMKINLHLVPLRTYAAILLALGGDMKHKPSL